VLDYQTKPFSFFAPSINRAWRSAAGNFVSAAKIDSRFCACAGTAMPIASSIAAVKLAELNFIGKLQSSFPIPSPAKAGRIRVRVTKFQNQ
jgi:hypothetical protein